MSNRRVGIWFIGAWGGVASTAALGLAALKRNLTDSTALVTATSLFEGLEFDNADSFVVGGHEIRNSSFLEAVSDLHHRANVFEMSVIEGCKEQLAAWNENVRPGSIVGSGATIGKLSDLPGAKKSETPRQIVERFQADLRDFQKRHNLDQVVVVSVASTEPSFVPDANFETAARFQAYLEKKDAAVPTSALYAWAGISLGFNYVNFTPSLGASFPAALEVAKQKGVCVAGKDGKTGETLMKSVLAPMFALRNLRILSWVGHNIFGNRDGLVLDDPVNKESKIRTKDQLIQQVVGYKPQTLVTIEYIESMDDWKTAWNHIHYKGFLGTKMILQFIWQGCDSLLAAPLVLDLARLTLFSQRRGETGVLNHLACFFKSPTGVESHDFFQQFRMLEEYVKGVQTTPKSVSQSPGS